jgi:predicted Zn-dependent protease
VKFHLQLARKYGADESQLEREQWLLAAQLGRMREAEPHLAELLSSTGDDQREACEAYVRGYLANLRMFEAQQLLTAWTRDFPADQEGWFLQGSIHEKQSNFVEAADAYRRAAELAPARIDVKLRLSDMLAELRQTDESHRLLAECLTALPDDPAVLLAWSTSLQSRGQLAEAEQSVRKLLRIEPRHVEAQILLGELLVVQQKFDEAIELFSAALAQRPHDTTVRYHLAKALSARGREAEAKPHLDFVAEAQEPIGRLDGMVLKAVQNPRDAALRFDIGSILWKYGSPDDAVRWMRSVLELDPEHRGAHQILAEYVSASERDGSVALPSNHLLAVLALVVVVLDSRGASDDDEGDDDDD